MTRKLSYGRKGAAPGTAQRLVIFLHGYGADGADLLDLADALAPHLPDTAFVAPDAPEPCRGNPFGRQWFPIPRMDGSSEAEAASGLLRAAEDLNALIDDLAINEKVAPQQIALLGFSQGAMMALHIAPRRDAALGCVVAISGRLLAPERLASEARQFPPVLLIHGDADPVVPFDEMPLAGDALVKAGFPTYAHVMEGTGHGIAPDGLSAALTFLKSNLG